MEMQQPRTFLIDEHFDVRRRLQQLDMWRRDVESEEAQLIERIRQLDPTRLADRRLSARLVRHRQLLHMRLLREPLEIAIDALQRVGYMAIRNHLAEQFVLLSKDERHLWLNNFLFIITPEVRLLINKLVSAGQRDRLAQYGWLLGGKSGMGKTMTLEWYLANNTPALESDPASLPVVKIDAPVDGRPFKRILERIALECGALFSERDTAPDLTALIANRLQQMDTQLLIIDEVEHVRFTDNQRHVLEMANTLSPITVNLASCSPRQWIANDPQMQERWSDYVELAPYTGERLRTLLALLELIIPLPDASHLAEARSLVERRRNKHEPEPPSLIEQLTGGVLSDVINLVVTATSHAIDQDLRCLSPELLVRTWQELHGNWRRSGHMD